MTLITEASEFPDDLYHTVTIEQEESGDFHIAATSMDSACIDTVGSIALGEEAVGLESGDMRLGAADQMMELTYRDFTDEYGYEEVQVTFVEKMA